MLGEPRQGWWGRVAMDLTRAGVGCSIPVPTPLHTPVLCGLGIIFPLTVGVCG